MDAGGGIVRDRATLRREGLGDRPCRLIGSRQNAPPLPNASQGSTLNAQLVLLIASDYNQSINL